MSKQQVIDKKSSKQLSRGMRRLITVVLVLTGILLFDLSPFGGNIRFYSTWIECGQKPVQTATTPGAGIHWYVQSKSFEPGRYGYVNYFCTALEAEQAGFSANKNQYELPEMRAHGLIK